ncbi:hypothetical protein ABIB82_002713 [Bradyrhizobium sp. i1.8.4]|uniref:hypothetical protein n=1 Tax=unclassified Bradyrhizobium TaxID=2631580 RepID=UPI003D23E222
MEDALADLTNRMHAAKRSKQLMLLAVGISGMTIFACAHYDDENSVTFLRRANEAIHRLAGHLRDLCDPDEAFAEGRLAVVHGALVLLHPSEIARILGR